MPAKLTVFPPRSASHFFLVPEGESRRAGRDPANDLVLDDPRVSARHARLEWSAAGWRILDLSSKNGTFVNGMPVDGSTVADEDWISFGGLLSRFELVSEDEVRALAGERRRRLETSAEIPIRLRSESDPRALLRHLVESVLDVTGAERGFVLLAAEDGRLTAEVAAGFSAGDAREEGFQGSLTAVSRVLATGESVVASDARGDALLGRQPSVADLGIRALACVPLRADGRTFGVIYVDGRRPGGSFTELDLEILEALAAHAGLVIAGCRIEKQIRELLRPPGSSSETGAPDLFEALESSLRRGDLRGAGLEGPATAT